MARDLDFIKKPSNQPPISRGSTNFSVKPLTTAPTKTVVAPNQLPPRSTSVASPKNHRHWTIWILIVVCVILLVFGLLLYKSARVALTPRVNPPTTQNTVVSGAKADEAASNAVVQVYDSGAGTQVLNQTLSLLGNNKINAQSLSTSEFQYDRTYIWYQPAYLDEAQQVASLLKDRDVALRPSQITGSFTILVYLGKK